MAPVAALATATQVWQVLVLVLSHVPAAQVAVQVVIPVVPTVFFVVVAAAHDPVAKRLSVADVQVYVTPVAAAPGMTVQAVHATAFCCTKKKSTVKREKQDLEDNIFINMYVCVWLDYVNVDQKNIHEQSSSRLRNELQA